MFDYQPVLDSPILRMRPVAAEDWSGLLEVGADQDVWAGHPNSDRYLEDRFRAYFEDGLKSGGTLVALEPATGKIIGWSRYSAEFVEPGEIEIGWTFLGKAYWGGAWNGEMKRLMLAHAFKHVERVILRIAETNVRSRRAAEKIGARALPGRGGDGFLFYGVERSSFAGEA